MTDQAERLYYTRLSTFRAFSAINRERAEIWHNGSIDGWSPSDWFTALAGEVGELGNVIKKLNRVRDGLPAKQATPEQLQQQLAEELADRLHLSRSARAAHGRRSVPRRCRQIQQD